MSCAHGLDVCTVCHDKQGEIFHLDKFDTAFLAELKRKMAKAKIGDIINDRTRSNPNRKSLPRGK